MKETWGSKCDGLLFISNVVDPDLPSVKVEYPHMEEDSHDNLWPKMQASVKMLWDTYKGKGYDWYYKVDDDSFPLIENLRHYLLSPHVQAAQKTGKGVYIGRRMNTTDYQNRQPHRVQNNQCRHGEADCCVFNAGGPGYLFDNVALEALARTAHSCRAGIRAGVDDLYVGCCLEAVGVHALDTRDAQGGDRFHVFDPQFCLDYMRPKDEAKAMREDWYFGYSYDPKEKMAGCAPDTVAWHHLSPSMIQNMWKLYYTCGKRYLK